MKDLVVKKSGINTYQMEKIKKLSAIYSKIYFDSIIEVLEKNPKITAWDIMLKTRITAGTIRKYLKDLSELDLVSSTGKNHRDPKRLYSLNISRWNKVKILLKQLNDYL